MYYYDGTTDGIDKITPTLACSSMKNTVLSPPLSSATPFIVHVV